MGEILTRHGEKTVLSKLFNTSMVTVRSALKGHTHSELSKKIRKSAIERGGIEIETETNKKQKTK